MYVKVQSTVQSLYQRNKFKNAVTFHLKMVFIESFSIFDETCVILPIIEISSSDFYSMPFHKI